MTDITSRTLPEGTILSGRYLLGAVRKMSDAGIAYTAFDRKLRIPAEVYEYYPTDCAVRQQDGSIAAKPGSEVVYRDKCRRLRDKGNLCLHQPESDVYDVLSINGTLYFIHAVSSEKAADFYAYGAEESPDESGTAPDTIEDDEKTRTVRGLFYHTPADKPEAPQQNDDRKTEVFPAVELQDKPAASDEPGAIDAPSSATTKTTKVQKPKKHAQSPDNAPVADVPDEKKPKESENSLPAPNGNVPIAPAELSGKEAEKSIRESTKNSADEKEADAESSGTNLKLLFGILAGGVLLLILCCTVFLVSLSRITGNNGQVASVIGVPLSEVDDVANTEIRVVGRTVDPSYAAGMIVAETPVDDTLEVTVNGEIPSYAVPDFIGMTESGAQSLFARTRYQNTTGLVTGKLQITYEETTEYPDGMVFAQSPEAGTERNAADISVKVAKNAQKSDKAAAVPALVGKSYSRERDGFSLLITDRVYSDTVPAGSIASQYPTAGERIAGGVCYVVVSLGKESTAVPDVTYMTLSEAENALYERGLSYTVRYELHSGIADGLVAIQNPAAGSNAAYGDVVTLSVSGDGEWTAGATFRTTEDTFTLSPGEQVKPEWDGISGDGTLTFHSSDPHTVAISDAGEVMALHSGHAVITASYGGSTLALPFTVTYPTADIVKTEIPCDEKLSLTGLTERSGCRWTVRAGDAAIEGDTLVGNTAGDCVVSGETENEAVLLRITLTTAEKDKKYVTFPKKSITNETETKKLLTDMGVSCTVETEYSQTIGKGRVTKIRYTGYSDSDSYYFTEGTGVTLIVSLGKPGIVSLRIDKKPAKLTYSVGDTLNVSGMTVTATYADGTEQSIPSGYTTEYDFSKAGRQTVAVSYEGRKASFAVEVVDTTAQKATIKTLPDKLTYAPGDTIDTTGLTVEVTYGNGTKKVFKSGFTVKADLAKVGDVAVQVTIEGLQTSFNVKVAEKKVRSLDLVKLPDKTDYVIGETLNTSGMQLRANYTDGTTATITSGWSTACDLTKAGASTVTVTYGGKTVTFAVTVKETETAAPVTMEALSVLTMPDKTEYHVGDKFDPAGLVLLAAYSDGSTKKFTDGFSASYDFSTVGEQAVRFQLDGMTTQIAVTVREKTTLLHLSADDITLSVGESAELTVTVAATQNDVVYSVDGATYVELAQTNTGLQITGVAPGKCTLTFNCAGDTAVCVITVRDKPVTSGTISYSTPVINETGISFMPTLVFENPDKADATVSFTARVTFDPNRVACADTGSSLSGVSTSFDGKDTVTITGEVVIPAEGSLTIAYVLFLGTDQSAFTVTVE